MIHCQERPSDAQSKPNATAFNAERFFFSKNRRLGKPAEYSAVFADAPLRVSHPSFLILARISATDGPRLGLIVAKKHVKRANRRNLIKRMARESFRLQQHNIPSIDAIVLARRGADAFCAAELTQIFNGLWKRLNKRASAQPKPD